MKRSEYSDRVLQIRRLINTLADDMGATYSTRLQHWDKIVNDALNGDLAPMFEDDCELVTSGAALAHTEGDCTVYFWLTRQTIK